MEYDRLVELNQSGAMNNLDFLLAQTDLASEYVEDMQAQDITPNTENALEWLIKYENKHLYQ